MPAFTLAGTSYDITAFEEGVPRQRGEIMTAFDNTLRSSISSEKRTFTATTAPLSKTKYEAAKTALANGASATLTGDVLLGASVTVRGTVRYALVGTGTADTGYFQQYVLTFNLAEA